MYSFKEEPRYCFRLLFVMRWIFPVLLFLFHRHAGLLPILLSDVHNLTEGIKN